jgi:hypothetical protein
MAKGPSAFVYEQYAVPPAEWETCGAPDEAILVLREEQDNMSVALAKHPEYGWAVLGTQGQGPVILWRKQDGVQEWNQHKNKRDLTSIDEALERVTVLSAWVLKIKERHYRNLDEIFHELKKTRTYLQKCRGPLAQPKLNRMQVAEQAALSHVARSADRPGAADKLDAAIDHAKELAAQHGLPDMDDGTWRRAIEAKLEGFEDDREGFEDDRKKPTQENLHVLRFPDEPPKPGIGG